MDDPTENHRIEPFPRARRLITDVGRLARNRPTIRGLLEIDVTRPRDLIRAHAERTGETLSFTAYLTACTALAVESNKYLHACRDWLGRLVIYDDVDVATMIEVDRNGKRFPVGHIIRAANRRSFREVHDEIRAVQSKPMAGKEVKRLYALNFLPGLVRRWMLRLLDRIPRFVKRYKGTVVVSAVGMFGRGGAFGLALPSHTLGVTVGGIAKKPGVHEGRIEPREVLHVTLDFDHDVIDGAPAARFARRFREIVESGHGLPDASSATLHPGRDHSP